MWGWDGGAQGPGPRAWGPGPGAQGGQGPLGKYSVVMVAQPTSLVKCMLFQRRYQYVLAQSLYFGGLGAAPKAWGLESGPRARDLGVVGREKSLASTYCSIDTGMGTFIF